MPMQVPEVSRNALVGALDETDLQRWLPFMERVTLPAGEVLSDEGVKTRHVYFPLTAIVSKLHMMEDGSSAEIAVIGNEGLVGMSVVLGGAVSAIRAVVLTRGEAIRIPTDFLRQELGSPHIQRLLLRFIYALISQMSHTAACNRHHVLDQQLCRWLLLRLDRASGNDLWMTQELMATMLGVRREGVTEAAMKLQRAGLIRYARGRIEIVDRAGLEKRSCECYYAVKKTYDSLLPSHAFSPLYPAAYRPHQVLVTALARDRPPGGVQHARTEAAPPPPADQRPSAEFASPPEQNHIRVPRVPDGLPSEAVKEPFPGIVPHLAFCAPLQQHSGKA